MPNRPKSDEQKTIEKTHSMVSGIYENTELEYDMLMHHELIDNLKSISIKVETILEFLDRKKVSAIINAFKKGDGSICENCNADSLIQFCKSCDDNNFAKHMRR